MAKKLKINSDNITRYAYPLMMVVVLSFFFLKQKFRVRGWSLDLRQDIVSSFNLLIIFLIDLYTIFVLLYLILIGV